MQKFITTKDVAKIMGVHIRTVENWIRAGDLKAYKPKTRYVIHKDDLNEFLKKCVSA